MREVIKNPDEVRNLRPDWSEAEIHHYTRTGEEPAHKMGLVDHKGALVERLRDSEPIRADQALDPREAAKQLRAFREADAAYRSQLAEQLQAAAAAQTQPEPVADPAPPTPRQSDDAALAQQRAHLEAQQRWMNQTAAIAHLSVDEQACAKELRQIGVWLNSSYTPSELQSGQAVGEERQAWLTEAVQRAAGLQRVAANAAEVRTVKQASLTLARQAAVEQWSATQDAAFAKHVQEHRPEFASEAGQVRMQKATLGYLQRTTGLSEQEIKQRWRAGQWRSTPEQIVLLDAVSHDLAKQSMRDLNAHKRPIPPVTPGAARPRGADAEQSIADLERRMANASSGTPEEKAEIERQEAADRKRQEEEAQRAAEIEHTCDATDKTFSWALRNELAKENQVVRISPAVQRDFAAFQKCCSEWGLPHLPAPPQAAVLFLAQASEKKHTSWQLELWASSSVASSAGSRATLEKADQLYDEIDDLLPAFADAVRHSNIPASYYVTAWRARGLGDARVVLRQALQDGEH
jgi:hypothetical protein